MNTPLITVITGEPGSGKSRLLYETWQQAGVGAIIHAQSQFRDDGQRQFTLQSALAPGAVEQPWLLAEPIGTGVYGDTDCVYKRYRVDREAAYRYIEFLRAAAEAPVLYFDELAPMQFQAVPELEAELRRVLGSRRAAGLPTLLTARLEPWDGPGNNFVRELMADPMTENWKLVE